MSERVQLSRKKGWRMPPNTVKVDRSTRWGNPFVVGEHGSRAYCVDLYRLLMSGWVCVSCGLPVGVQEASYAYVKRNRHRIKGKNLACWCPLNQPCHADVLLEIAND